MMAEFKQEALFSFKNNLHTQLNTYIFDQQVITLKTKFAQDQENTYHQKTLTHLRGNTMSEFSIFWVCIIVAIIGCLSIVGIFLFGQYLFSSQISRYWSDHPYWMEIMASLRNSPNAPRHIADLITEFIQRRNEFWTTYGQILISTLIIVILSILLLTKTITAEAGLPILSGISGFAIAKGVSLGSASSSDHEIKG